jgi:hypothetical protein
VIGRFARRSNAPEGRRTGLTCEKQVRQVGYLPFIFRHHLPPPRRRIDPDGRLIVSQ